MTTVTQKRIRLSQKHQEIFDMPTKFFEFLKEKYGVQGTELLEEDIKRGQEEHGNCADDWPIFRSIQLSIPGFPVNNKNHKYSIHLERSDNAYDLSDKNISLILGEQ